ncbi:DNA helicase [Oxalobacteraceae bacterium IMCC9480]|nr:DNA helicase [Oxalobacteraceae bacterium IMCC9480]
MSSDAVSSPTEIPEDVGVSLQLDKTTGYAAIQNHVPVVRSLTLQNKTEEPLTNIEVVISCSPAFAVGARLKFDRLQPGETRKISPIDLQPDHGYLSKLDETEQASVNVKVTAGDRQLAYLSSNIEVLAYDQWAGTRALPELLAAFCMPNSQVVDQLVSGASTLVRQLGNGSSMNGYQSKNREKVWQQVSAIYSTLLAENFHYSNPPASFGNDGQKIRTPERILTGRVATCLDLSMLFASCVEQTGLHPVILFKEGHAWVGVWLIEASFPTALVDDVQAIRKRIKSGELLVIETTGIASGQKPTLRWACATGEEHLNEESSFQYAIDVRRARELQIRPLPSRSNSVDSSILIATEIAPSIEAMPALPSLDPASMPAIELETIDTPEGRLARWKSKLLDLTLRNRLLNFKPVKTSLRLVCPDPAALEDILSEGKEFRIRALPLVMSGSDNRDAGVFAARTGLSPFEALANDALRRHEIIVDVAEEALEPRLLEIFRAAGTGLEEGGANTLFMVFGLLQWKEEEKAEGHHLAPILLVPVTLTRQSVRSGFRLTRHDDEALVNPTLVQKLWQSFQMKMPSLDVMPLDDKGIDVAKVLQTFRLQVAELKGWEVKDQVHLGIFSFTKYLMWKDLQARQARLQQNSIVAHLINNPGRAFADSDIGFEPSTLDASHRPQDIFAPMLSDSSQLRAICAASAGKNLVIEGPPGTGKSQTITNLISHLLATGKTVLFVSEKMAALEVVHRRLKSLGLGPFCLELHSSKAKKSEVLKQLGMALETAGTRTVADWEREAERLAVLRQELNELANALHKVYPNDLTIYDAIGLCIKYGERRPAPMDWTDASLHSRTDIELLREISRRMAALASQLSGLNAHPLSIINRPNWTPTWQQLLLDTAAELRAAAAKVQEISAPILGMFGHSGLGLSLAELATFDALADVLIRAPSIPIGIARSAHDDDARSTLAFLRHHGVARQTAWSMLNGAYREEIAALTATEIALQWAEAQATWWPKKWFAKRVVFNRLRLFKTNGRPPVDEQIAPLLATLATINKEDKALDSVAAVANNLLAEGFSAQATDWAVIEGAEQWALAFSEAVTRMAGSDAALAQMLRTNLQSFVAENRAMLKPDGAIGSSLLHYRDAFRDFTAKLVEVGELGSCTEALSQDRMAPGAITRLQGVLMGWQQSSRQIQPWCLWQDVRAKAISNGLHGLVSDLENGHAGLDEISEFFEYSYQSWWVKKAIDRESVLCTFSSADHGRKIDEFRSADARFQTLTQQFVVAKLSGQIPTNAGIVPGADSEMGKLRRELQRQRGNMPIRQLVQNLPTLMSKLKPCLLMSPLSVAQYLDAGHAQFDVVIFDEASQIPVWDAVGAIARGNQLICVGDPKQLPPTNFFGRSDDSGDGAGEDEIQDLESILDECLSIGMPKLSLNWHYRSKHESLITFSNVMYYDNRLVTFPSPVTDDKGVRFERVSGVYDRGGSRTNRAEADAIVKSIETHYTNPTTRNQTLGVVTFNQAQQSLIERTLDERRRGSAALDQAIAQATLEPLFIKNLENVQGDERDIIYFSITYGPDAAGKVNLNFGPLNLEGGHRRLNVAVSRARQGVVVFSTLLPEQIDLSRVRAAGVRDLKNYLEFAIRGPRALVEQIIPTGLEPDSPLEMQVISALRDKGWTVHPQVGVSGYRIDIGVVDPRAPGRYLLGIECDGRTYHSGATARDRDRLRQHILESLGWELYRIWSTDWWMNPQEPMRKLLSRLEELVTQEAETTGEQDDVEMPANDHADTEDAGPAQCEVLNIVPEVIAENALPRYTMTQLPLGPSDKFYEKATRSILLNQLLKVVNTEGPVSEFEVFKRVRMAWGLSKTGSRVQELLTGLLAGRVSKTNDGTIFYWPETVDPAAWEGFRSPETEDGSKRLIDEVCLEELGNIAIFILSEQGRTSVPDLAKSVCTFLSIARVTAAAEERVTRALKHDRAGKQFTIDDTTRTVQIA